MPTSLNEAIICDACTGADLSLAKCFTISSSVMKISSGRLDTC